ncbi:YhcN/YlaJ family sporulation lipoprotein [Oceanobacillus sp. 1P07AA]|uniref:YhcN/YlaJ family sporulation lipoprotein n=1 Tax=Oceanobacillus sp. 1P07AA TaxID=3132293 RepID=UPI0039A574D5
MRIYNSNLLISVVVLGTVLMGCTDDNTASDLQNNNRTESESVQPIHFEDQDMEDSNQQSIGEQGGYIQSRQYGVNETRANHYTDAFTNEESIRLTESLRNRVDVVQAQVASTEERIVVGVILKEHASPDTGDKLVKHIERQLEDSNKEIIVYTDDVQWDRMKNLDSRLQAEEIGEQVESLFEDIFQLNTNE